MLLYRLCLFYILPTISVILLLNEILYDYQRPGNYRPHQHDSRSAPHDRHVTNGFEQSGNTANDTDSDARRLNISHTALAVNPTTGKKLAASLAEVNVLEYKEQLTAHASSEHVIILSLVDMSFLDMTLNFLRNIDRKVRNRKLFIHRQRPGCLRCLSR